MVQWVRTGTLMGTKIVLQRPKNNNTHDGPFGKVPKADVY